jgi:hypothetical protein
MYRPFPNGHRCPFGCTGNGYVTVMAVGQRQRLYSGVRMFTGTGNYPSSTPRAFAGNLYRTCSAVPTADVFPPRHSTRPFHHTRSSIACPHPPHPPITQAPAAALPPPARATSFAPSPVPPSLLPSCAPLCCPCIA